MSKVLIITNDFPPRTGGIQSFLHSVAAELSEHVVVYAPAWHGADEFDRAQPFPVFRHPTSLMLPLPSVRRRALAILATENCDRVLFGAAAPLGLLAPALRVAGAKRIVALTHGHEAGWAAVPIARSLLQRIGESADVVTYLGEYFRERLAGAFSPAAAARMRRVAPAVDAEIFHPDAGGTALRSQLGLKDSPIILCVSRLVARKGQDMLIQAMPAVLQANDGRPTLLLVGSGPYAAGLRRIAHAAGVADRVRFAGEVPTWKLPAYYDAADLFAMPCRTRWGGLDVEGLGMVFLEAAAAGLPVIVGDSGGAPEAVRNGQTGYVVPGRDVRVIAERINHLLADPGLAQEMGAQGRAWMKRSWRWSQVGLQIGELLEL